MRTINSMLTSLEKLDMPFLMETSFQDTSPEYVKLQRDQMIHGLNADGTQIGKYRNSAYARKKAEMNGEAGFGNVDLRLTGSFFEEIFVDVRSDEFVVDSADEKSAALQQKYGEKIFGLADDRKGEFIEELKPVFVQMVTDQLNEK